MSDLPRQLQRQAEEIAAFDKAIADAAVSPVVEPEPPEPVTPEPVGTPKVVAPATPTPPSADELQWRQRYQTLEGKYRAEVPRLHDEVRELKQLLKTATDAMRPPTPVTPEPPRAPKVTPKDVENFGPDLIDLIRRSAEEIAADANVTMKRDLDKLRAENEQLKASISGVTKSQEVSAQEIYLSKLTTMVPDWATINVDPQFLDWLAGIDPLSGLTRQQYVDNAFQNLDVPRTATIFNAWKALNAAPATPAPPKSEVQRQVEPGKSKSVPIASQQDNQTRTYTHAEIEKFYRELREGKIPVADVQRLEAEIDLAVAQGRVR